jgi:hypothetical protein
MSETTFQQHGPLLIRHIFFAVIIAVGLDKFVNDFLVSHTHITNFFSTFSNISYLFNYAYICHHAPVLFNTIFFLVTLFWVISHWVYYNGLIKKYPYRRWAKFFVDIILFLLMFVVFDLSFQAYKIFSLFVLLVIIWHFFACFWHLSERGLRDHVKEDTIAHIKRLLMYTLIFMASLLYLRHTGTPTDIIVNHIIMATGIIAIIYCNVRRLKEFVYEKKITNSTPVSLWI